MSKKIVGKECRFVTHITNSDGWDVCVIKENLHYEDGTTKPNLLVVKDYKRPFWILKKHLRKYKDKRESEPVESLIRYETTESKLGPEIARRLGMRNPTSKVFRDVSNSPYVYGAGLRIESFISWSYKNRYPQKTPYSYAGLDIETNVDTGVITHISVGTLEEMVLSIHKTAVEDVKDPISKINKMYDEAYEQGLMLRKPNLKIHIFDTELEMLQTSFEHLHKTQPDLVLVWNLEFDIPYIIDRCKAINYDPKNLFSDPSISPKLRFYTWTKGPESFNGEPVKHIHRWGALKCPASFYFMDAMRGYCQARGGKNAKIIPGGYGMDNILAINDLPSKLRFPTGDELTGPDAHRYKSKKYPIRYSVYNALDVIQMLVLEDKNNDCSLKIPTKLGITVFEKATSNPQILTDKFFDYLYKRNLIPGVKPSRVNQDQQLGMKNWIRTLKAPRISKKGLNCIDGLPTLHTNIFAETLDVDATASYPSNGTAANISKDTTSKEVLDIEGFDKEEFKENNMSLLYGEIEIPRYVHLVYGIPSVRDIVKKIKEYKEKI